MELVPSKMLANIPTGNPYKGRNGLVDVTREQTTLDIAEMFPFHQIDNGSPRNIRSHLLGKQIRVGYHENNLISEIEVLAPDERIPEMAIQELMLGKINVFKKTLIELKAALEADDYEILDTDEGFDIQGGSVSFYSHDYEDDLAVGLDAVVLRFL